MIARGPVGPIQLSPPGLLDLLSLKIGGFNPDALLQTVQPTVELEPYWLRARAELEAEGWGSNVVFTGALQALQPFVDFATGSRLLGPDEKTWWYVHGLSATVSCGGGASVDNICLGWNLVRPGGTALFVLSPTVAAVTAGTAVLLSAGGFWLPPGAVLGVWVDNSVVGYSQTLQGLRRTVCRL